MNTSSDNSSADLIEDFVYAARCGDMQGMSQMLKDHPTLINAVHSTEQDDPTGTQQPPQELQDPSDQQQQQQQQEEQKTKNRRGNTALHMAAANGNLEMVRWLLSSEHSIKADSRQANAQGNRPVHWAAMNGHLEVVKVLLGADGSDEVSTEDAFVENDQGLSPADLAEQFGRVDIVNWYLQQFSHPSEDVPADVSEESATDACQGGVAKE